MLFNRKRTTSPSRIFAPMGGTVIPIAEVPDAVFAERLVGDGVAILPDTPTVVAPMDGTVALIAGTCHAIALCGADGVEVLIHIGLDTVSLNGGPFRVLVALGDVVRTGDPLVEVDLQRVVEAGHRLDTPVVVTNASVLTSLTTHTGPAIAGKTCVIEYQL